MQVKLNLIAGAAALLIGGAVYAQDLVVKIGHVGPTSGTAAHLGKDNEMGARMAIDELNAKGVTIGGKKAKLELLSEDDSLRHEVRKSDYQRLASKRGTMTENNQQELLDALLTY